MGVSGQRHAPATLLLGKERTAAAEQEAGWAPGPFLEKKIYGPRREANHSFSVLQPVTLSLCRLSYPGMISCATDTLFCNLSKYAGINKSMQPPSFLYQLLICITFVYFTSCHWFWMDRRGGGGRSYVTSFCAPKVTSLVSFFLSMTSSAYSLKM